VSRAGTLRPLPRNNKLTKKTHWRQDLAYAFRWLSKAPGFTAAAVISIGLSIGIAASSTIFPMVSTFILRPAPVGDPSTLMTRYTNAARRMLLQQYFLALLQ
jgi:hypothetical protein